MTLGPSTLSGDALKKLLFGSGSLGAGAAVAWFVIDLLRAEPKLAIQIVGQWGPGFVLVVILLYFVDRNFGQMIQLQREHVVAQQEMSAAVRQIADKDDRQAEEQRRLTGYLGSQQEKILIYLEGQNAVLDELKQAVNRAETQRARSATA